ncbi:MAG: hypothetical protein HY567_01760 [Candidatus Kerfeldbacteria bacterium]|nr:hypothetical protein [Candidatus Kerfeldbacteria bacterium]
MSSKDATHVFGDVPDLIYRMLSQSMRERIDDEIAAMKVRELPPAYAHHLMVEAVKANVLPASRLPKVIEAWDEPRHEEFRPRTAWSLFNAFTEVARRTRQGMARARARSAIRSPVSHPTTEPQSMKLPSRPVPEGPTMTGLQMLRERGGKAVSR